MATPPIDAAVGASLAPAWQEFLIYIKLRPGLPAGSDADAERRRARGAQSKAQFPACPLSPLSFPSAEADAQQFAYEISHAPPALLPLSQMRDSALDRLGIGLIPGPRDLLRLEQALERQDLDPHAVNLHLSNVLLEVFPRVPRRRREHIDIFGKSRQSVRGQRVAADQRVFDALVFEVLRETLDVFPGRGSRELGHTIWPWPPSPPQASARGREPSRRGGDK